MSSSNIDRLVAVALTIVGATVIYLSLDFPGDAGFFPVAMACLLILSCGLLFVQAARRCREKDSNDENFESRRFAIWVGLAILLFLTVWYVDFYLAVFGFILLSYLLLANRSFALSISLSALFTVVLFIGFDTLLGVPTPSRIQFYINWL